jgi:hypothetical protein
MEMRTIGAIRTLIEEQGATPNIPAKSNRNFSKRLYRESGSSPSCRSFATPGGENPNNR